jgi:histidine decarboxylase
VTVEIDNLTSELAISTRLEALRRELRAGHATNIGFPGASDVDYSEITPFFGSLLNNVGDPWTDPAGAAHTKLFEREVLDWFADLFGAPADDRWGYLTSGGTEGNLYGLHLARTRFPDGMVYHSAAAHYSVPKCLDLLGMASLTVRAGVDGEMDYEHLTHLVERHRDRPAIVVANAGTTMTEAVDDVAHIQRVLGEFGVRRHVHVDAALAGVPLALMRDAPTVLHLGATIDSISISGHKFLAAPTPCGVVLTRNSLRRGAGQSIAYTATPDTTISGSRSGQAALLLWYVIRRYGLTGLRARADSARELARYATRSLTDIGWPAWRHPHAFTVVFRTPPSDITDRWVLASSDGWSHLICMPGLGRAQIDAFTADLAGRQPLDPAADGRLALPRQRLPHPAPVGQR